MQDFHSVFHDLPNFQALLASMVPLVSHVALLTYAEAYVVVADLLARKESWESLEQQECIDEALKLGRQAFLQRRISSESSIGKLLYKNGFQMLQHRQQAATNPTSCVRSTPCTPGVHLPHPTQAATDEDGLAVQCTLVEEEGVPTVQCDAGGDERPSAG